MATLQVATTSTGAIVSDPQAVRELCESYCFGTLNWEVTDEGELTISRNEHHHSDSIHGELLDSPS